MKLKRSKDQDVLLLEQKKPLTRKEIEVDDFSVDKIMGITELKGSNVDMTCKSRDDYLRPLKQSHSRGKN